MTFSTFQNSVRYWILECFGSEISDYKPERNQRFLEEALELVQSCGMSPEDAHRLVDYVYSRPVGDKVQEGRRHTRHPSHPLWSPPYPHGTSR